MLVWDMQDAPTADQGTNRFLLVRPAEGRPHQGISGKRKLGGITPMTV